MISQFDLNRTIYPLKDSLGVSFFLFYNLFEKKLLLPPHAFRTKTELQQDLLRGLERIRREDYKTFVWAVRIIQKIEKIQGVPGALYYNSCQDWEGLLNTSLPTQNFGLTFYPGPVNNGLS